MLNFSPFSSSVKVYIRWQSDMDACNVTPLPMNDAKASPRPDINDHNTCLRDMANFIYNDMTWDDTELNGNDVRCSRQQREISKNGKS